MSDLTKVAFELRDAFETQLKPRIGGMEKAIDGMQDRMDEFEANGQKAGLAPSRRAVKGTGPFLEAKQAAAPHFKGETVDFDASQVRLGALLAAYVNSDAKKQLNVEEQKAFGTLIGPQGDLLIPSVIGGIFIDAIRPKTAVLAAGATVYPMEGRNVILPGWDIPPKAGWRGEKGSFADGGGSFREVSLNAKDVGAFADVPNSLFEDAAGKIGPVADLIEEQLSKAIAQAIDLAALTSQDALSGSGTHIPQGLTSVAADGTVSTNYGVPLATSSGTNGGTPATWDWHIDAAAAVAGANFTPTAHLAASRTLASLAKLKLTTNDYLRKPPYLAGVRDFETNQVGVAFKKGTNTDTSLSFVGDFSNLVVGMRGDLTVLRDPYTQGLTRSTRLIVSIRADVAVLNAPAFVVIDGIRP